MHAFCGATNKLDGCLWCFRRQEDAIAFREWCVENHIVLGDKPP
jgi:hypothetical protein